MCVAHSLSLIIFMSDCLHTTIWRHSCELLSLCTSKSSMNYLSLRAKVKEIPVSTSKASVNYLSLWTNVKENTFSSSKTSVNSLSLRTSFKENPCFCELIFSEFSPFTVRAKVKENPCFYEQKLIQFSLFTSKCLLNYRSLRAKSKKIPVSTSKS